MSPAPACQVCQGPSLVFCVQDAAFLCKTCDISCHSNVLSQRHTRTRVCELCHGKPSEVRQVSGLPANTTSYT
jgi:Zn finger protein HypA/HybF involved in hydrogenase expression